MQAAFERASKGRTMVVVAHRLATVQNADVIFVLGEGQLLEQGSHMELLKKKGVYWNMVSLFFFYHFSVKHNPFTIYTSLLTYVVKTVSKSSFGQVKSYAEEYNWAYELLTHKSLTMLPWAQQAALCYVLRGTFLHVRYICFNPIGSVNSTGSV